MVDVFLQRLVEDEDVVEEEEHTLAVDRLESCRQCFVERGRSPASPKDTTKKS